MKNFFPRLFSGIVYVALIWAGTTIHPIGLIALMSLFYILCFIEFVKMAEIEKRIYVVVGFIIGALILGYYGNLFWSAFQQVRPVAVLLKPIFFIGPILFFVAALTIFRFTNEMQNDYGKITIAVVYTAFPFALALTFPRFFLDLGQSVMSHEIFYLFILLWTSDTFAYLVGSKLGKTKLMPSISPGKSAEGLIGGITFTIIAGFIIHQYVSNLQGDWRIIAFIVAILAPIGDLAESKLKRYFQVKDSGNLIPGHGGFLDRLDSFIFVAPYIYLYFLLIKVL